MPYACGDCSFFAGEGSHTRCPNCGGSMKFTMFGGPATATATLEPTEEQPKEAWEDPYQFGYEEIEAPWAFRYAQIGVGISTYFFLSRWAHRILLVALLAGGEPTERQLIVAALAAVLLGCVAAFAGGAVAGLWARNWIPQGLAVTGGVLAIPLILVLLFAPQSWPLFCLSLVANSLLTLLGAFVGHLVVKPTRIPKS